MNPSSFTQRSSRSSLFRSYDIGRSSASVSRQVSVPTTSLKASVASNRPVHAMSSPASGPTAAPENLPKEKFGSGNPVTQGAEDEQGSVTMADEATSASSVPAAMKDIVQEAQQGQDRASNKQSIAKQEALEREQPQGAEL